MPAKAKDDLWSNFDISQFNVDNFKKLNYYERLGIDQTASQSDIDKAFKRRALRCHPDKHPENSEKASTIFKLLGDAHEELSDPEKRKAYQNLNENGFGSNLPTQEEFRQYPQFSFNYQLENKGEYRPSIASSSISNNYLAIIDHDIGILLFNGRTGKLFKEYKPEVEYGGGYFPNAYGGVAISEATNTLTATHYVTGDIHVFDITSGKIIKCHRNVVPVRKWSPIISYDDNQSIIHSENEIKILHRNGKIRSIPLGKRTSISLSPDKKYLIILDNANKTVQLLDFKSGKTKKYFPIAPLNCNFYQAEMSADGNLLAYYGLIGVGPKSEFKIVIRDLKKNTEITYTRQEWIGTIQFTPDSQYLVISDGNLGYSFYSISQQKIVNSFSLPSSGGTAYIKEFFFTNNGRLIVIDDHNGAYNCPLPQAPVPLIKTKPSNLLYLKEAKENKEPPVRVAKPKAIGYQPDVPDRKAELKAQEEKAPTRTSSPYLSHSMKRTDEPQERKKAVQAATTLITFSRDGQLIDGWDMKEGGANHTWIIWKKQQDNPVYNGFDFNDQSTPLPNDTLETHKAKLHPIFLEFLRTHNRAEPGSALAFLYYLKTRQQSEEAKSEVEQFDAVPKIELYKRGGISIGWGREYGGSDDRHPITIEGMINFIRKKNKTHLNDQEIESAINNISQSYKTSYLQNFLSFYKSNTNNYVSRTELVEAWVGDYQSSNNINPFDQLTQHRERGCLKMFNPSKTASVQFFEKFLKGESISQNLRSMLDKDPYCEVAISQSPS